MLRYLTLRNGGTQPKANYFVFYLGYEINVQLISNGVLIKVATNCMATNKTKKFASKCERTAPQP